MRKLTETAWYDREKPVLRHLKAGFHSQAVFTSLNVAFVPISRSRFKQRQIPPLRTFTNVLWFC